MKSHGKEIRLYTDGSSRGNPGPGGWGAILITIDQVVELAGSQNPATNNQMELTAVIEGLAYAQDKFSDMQIELHADSRYVLNGIEKWLDGWVRNGWITMAKKPVENKALWESLLKLRDHFNSPSAGGLKLVKVDGHSGHLYNDRCDELAVLTALDKNPKLFNGSNIEYEKYLKQNPPSSPKKIDTKKGNTYSYVSLVDGKVYADKDWATCEKRVKGKKAKFKKVFSKEEETDLIQNYTLASLL